MKFERKRLNGGEEITNRSFKDAMEHAGLTNPPCFCANPSITIMKRGTEADSIFWCECEMCKRQYQPAWTRNGAVYYLIEAHQKKKDPYKLGLPKPDRTAPKIGYVREVPKQARKSRKQRRKK